MPYKKKHPSDPARKPDKSGNWDAFARNRASGMSLAMSYINAGYNCNMATACRESRRLVKQPYIQQRLWELGQKADVRPVEVLQTLRNQMMADIADFIDEEGNIDMSDVIESGQSRLIKRIKFHKENGKVSEFELYSAQDAAKALLAVCGLEQAPRVNDADKQLIDKQVQKVMDAMSLDEAGAREWIKDNVPTASNLLM